MKPLAAAVAAGVAIVVLVYAATKPTAPPGEIVGVWDLYSQADTLVELPPGDEHSFEFNPDGKVVLTSIYHGTKAKSWWEGARVRTQETEEGCFRVILIPEPVDNPIGWIASNFIAFAEAEGAAIFLICGEEMTQHSEDRDVVYHQRR